MPHIFCSHYLNGNCSEKTFHSPVVTTGVVAEDVINGVVDDICVTVVPTTKYPKNEQV